jgi:hypothetical protein
MMAAEMKRKATKGLPSVPSAAAMIIEG